MYNTLIKSLSTNRAYWNSKNECGYKGGAPLYKTVDLRVLSELKVCGT